MAIEQRSKRFGVLIVVALVAFGLLGTRLWFLQTDEAETLQADIDRERTKTVALVPERGRIFDAKGRILADNQRILTVAVDWAVMRNSRDREELFTRLSGWLDVPVEEMEERYHANVYSPYLPMPVKEDVDQDIAVALRERAEDFPGVEVVLDWKRTYPYAPLASHVVGYMGAIDAESLDHYLEQGYVRNETVGKSGVELSMEQQLHGETGERVYEVNSAGQIVRTISERPAVNGKDIQLSIDLDTQQFAEQLLQQQLERIRNFPTVYQADNPIVRDPITDQVRGRMDPNLPEKVPYSAPAGGITLMNYATGQVAAMASYPTYDNRWFNAGVSSDKFAEIFPPEDAYETRTEAADNATLTNRAIQGQYNFGSAFKPFSAYVGLQAGVYGAWTQHLDDGWYTMTSIDSARCESGEVRCRFRNAWCNHLNGPCQYGAVDVYKALAVSSDTYFYRIGEESYVRGRQRGRELFKELIEEWGFGTPTGIDLPYEFSGRVPSDELKADLVERGVLAEHEVPSLTPGDNLQASIGQGLMAGSPLQLAVAYGALGNGGDVLTPRVVRAIYEPGVPDGRPGYADLSRGELVRAFMEPEVQHTVEMSEEEWARIKGGLRHNITGPRFPEGTTTSMELFHEGMYPDDAIQIAGKTGTAQGFGNYPWNDSSVFGAYSIEPDRPYVVTAYLEKGGYGSRGAAPVVKCMFLALSGHITTDPVVQSDPLDIESSVVAEHPGTTPGFPECTRATNFDPDNLGAAPVTTTDPLE